MDSRRFRVQYGRFQSTHPSGVRHEAGEVVVLGGGISIHAPQWGATKYPKAFVKVALDFNPRTPVGCDGGSETVDSGRDEFQSTHPSGVRHLEGRRHSHPIDFNPRTPVGCDLSPPLIRRCRRYFNPRTPVGCDSLGLSELNSSETFQSTHPSGVRLMLRKRTQPTSNFNPRTPVGCDLTELGNINGSIISIHAPQWGATVTVFADAAIVYDFNPRTPVGCDRPRGRGLHRRAQISIHAPQWGAT